MFQVVKRGMVYTVRIKMDPLHYVQIAKGLASSPVIFERVIKEKQGPVRWLQTLKPPDDHTEVEILDCPREGCLWEVDVCCFNA
nr:hypothetical protein [Tanacetum cinerariifolium]